MRAAERAETAGPQQQVIAESTEHKSQQQSRELSAEIGFF